MSLKSCCSLSSSDDIELAGASPETLAKLENGTLSTFPLAGTRPRGKTREEDKELEEGLLKDEKELAGSEFGCSGKGSCRKDCVYCIHSVFIIPDDSCYCGAQMHYMGKTFYAEILFYFYSSDLADLSNIVSSQVYQRIVFCLLFLIFQKSLFNKYSLVFPSG